CEDRRLFILLQLKKGSYRMVDDVPYVECSLGGGMLGDPYMGMHMGKGYFVKKCGWGSRERENETEIYRFRKGKLELVKDTLVEYDSYSVGYKVTVREEGDAWHKFAIAIDGERTVWVDLCSREYPVGKAFPEISLYNMFFIFHHEKLQTNLQPADALELFRETVPGAVREELAYADWQKENYELLFGVDLPEYYYVVPDGETSSDAGEKPEGEQHAESDCFYYYGLTDLYGEYYHRIQYIKDGKREEYLIMDATGEINAS
ncbi:MAG: hypothetical protein HDR26_07570, partial [Lachnospiraceae bacterium]|nr:hypothetical protein [Lachnospiraceae bacterium]